MHPFPTCVFTGHHERRVPGGTGKRAWKVVRDKLFMWDEGMGDGELPLGDGER